MQSRLHLSWKHGGSDAVCSQEHCVQSLVLYKPYTFSALTLLVGWQEEHPVWNSQCSEKPGVFKKAEPNGFFGFYWVLGFIGFSDFFYLNEQLGSFLVDLAHQLSFCLDSPVLLII